MGEKMRKERNGPSAFKAACVAGLFILSVSSATASERSSPGRSEQVSTTPIEILSVSGVVLEDRKSTRLNSSHSQISYAVFCLKKKTRQVTQHLMQPAQTKP